MSHFVVAWLPEPIMPLDRIDRYEDPLDDALSARDLGEITGGGTQLTREKEIEFAVIELELADLDGAVDLVKRVLEGAGAPAGSELRFERGEEQVVLPLGKDERLTIYLDGVNLPEDVYQNTNIDELADQIFGRISPFGGTIRGSWAGPTETAIYIYGPNAEALFAQLEPLLRAYPLCQNARVVIGGHGKPGPGARTVRIPGHP